MMQELRAIRLQLDALRMAIDNHSMSTCYKGTDLGVLLERGGVYLVESRMWFGEVMKDLNMGLSPYDAAAQNRKLGLSKDIPDPADAAEAPLVLSLDFVHAVDTIREHLDMITKSTQRHFTTLCREYPDSSWRIMYMEEGIKTLVKTRGTFGLALHESKNGC